MNVDRREKHWKNDPKWQCILAKASDQSQTIHGDVVIHSYQSRQDPYFTSSYFFETERGVVLVDTQIYYSAAQELWDAIKSKTSGNIFAIINTHAHPDHYFGNMLFRKVAPNATIITSAGVLADMHATAAQRVAKTRKEWGDEVPSNPADLVYPDFGFERTLTLAFDKITLELKEVGPAEAPVQVVGWIPQHRALIAADILQNKQHHYFSDRTTANWYRILQEFSEMNPRFVLTGHQGIAGKELIEETKHWFATFLGLMSDVAPRDVDPENIDTIDAKSRSYVVSEMQRRFPDWFDPYYYEGKTVLEQCIDGHRSEQIGAQVLAALGSKAG
ncbi:MBL fold metallo-hydrolase [Mesorhizobium hawassense]|nr:MBL fold metallo-hydrolase [Mesorhizobium hawassense]